MSKDKKIEEMDCKKCLHYEMCLENFREAKKEGLWELTDEKEYFSHADECDFYAAGYRKQSEGEWSRFEVNSSKGYGQVYYHHKDCDFHATQLFPNPYHYCPNCGAKMKGGAGDLEVAEKTISSVRERWINDMIKNNPDSPLAHLKAFFDSIKKQSKEDSGDAGGDR